MNVRQIKSFFENNPIKVQIEHAEKTKSFWRSLVSSPLVIGFILTNILGVFVAFYFQNRSFVNQQEVLARENNRVKAHDFVKEFAQNISTFLLSQKEYTNCIQFYWANKTLPDSLHIPPPGTPASAMYEKTKLIGLARDTAYKRALANAGKSLFTMRASKIVYEVELHQFFSVAEKTACGPTPDSIGTYYREFCELLEDRRPANPDEPAYYNFFLDVSYAVTNNTGGVMDSNNLTSDRLQLLGAKFHQLYRAVKERLEQLE